MNVDSGKKYIDYYGNHAIKDGISNKKLLNNIKINKPDWLKSNTFKINKNYQLTKSITKLYNLSTVCQEAKCPNISECWSQGVATIMLMGNICTRSCKFCSVDTGNPRGFLDHTEPFKVANSVKLMNLKYIVLTSVDRDDLEDGGAKHYARVINAIRCYSKNVKVEVLTPDFQERKESIDLLLNTSIDVFAHNIETVQRLTKLVRDVRANYNQTINVLKYVKTKNPDLITKTSIMLGLGETKKEILSTMNDLRSANVDILTIGQYMQPTKYHLPVNRFVTPSEFLFYKNIGLKKGFLDVVSSPMSRSSYHADKIFNRI